MLIRGSGDTNKVKDEKIYFDQAYIAWFTFTRDTTDEFTVK